MSRKRLAFHELLSMEFRLAIAMSAAVSSTLALIALLIFFSRDVSIVVFILIIASPIVVALVLQGLVPALFERGALRRLIDDNDGPVVFAERLSQVSPWSVVIPAIVTMPESMIVMGGGAFERIGVMLFGLVFMMYSFAYHRISNGRRAVKYATFYLGVFLFNDGFVTGWSYTPLAYRMFTLTTYFLIRALIEPALEPRAGEASTKRAFAWYRLVMQLGPGPGLRMLVALLVRNIPVLGELYWSCRVCCKARLSYCPVLFLRSFSNAQCASVLGKLVVPAVARVAVLVALVHPSQTSAALNRRAHESWVPTTLAVAEPDWRGWFEYQLHYALAIVVDATVLHANTRWELETSIAKLGSARVAVLVPDGRRGEFSAGYVVEYGPGRYELARSQLAYWIDGVVRNRFMSVDSHAA